MMPLILKLKKAAHKEIAKAQDVIVEELYKVFDMAVLHGGTCIWRCYNGNRFSEDIDIYMPFDNNKLDVFFENAAKRGFAILKKKIGERSLYSALKLDKAVVRLECVFRRANGFLSDYETVDGNIITVYSLMPEDLIGEKVEAYLSRHKVRDIYDIFFLLRHVKEKKSVHNALQRLIKNYKSPIDEKDLKVLVIEGLTPSPEKMHDYIEHWM